MSIRKDRPSIPVVDLDAFLAGPTPARLEVPAGFEMPVQDRVTAVGMVLDDSASIHNRGVESQLQEGVELARQAFLGAKGTDFYLDIRGFRQSYFCGFLRNLKDQISKQYVADFRRTPLVSEACALYEALKDTAGKYRRLGVPTKIALLLITDGIPEEDTRSPGSFAAILDPADYIVGVGIAQRDDEAVQTRFQSLFVRMGIRNIKTPDSTSPAELRHTINEFSQSLASGAASRA